MSNWTPGPWKVKHRHCDCTIYDDERHGLGLEIEGPEPASNRGQFANSADARLIAKAPEMAALLKKFIDTGFYDDRDELYKEAEKLLAEIKGKPLDNALTLT